MGTVMDLPNIDEVSALSDEDRVCIDEIISVLEKHDRLKRFGLTLLHQHFPVEDGEILLE